MKCRRILITGVLFGCIAAQGVGCSLVKTPESQLFSRSGRYESASIEYCVGSVVPSSANFGANLASYQQPSAPAVKPEGRKVTLAVHYPHPSGRYGFARAELIVENQTANKSSSSRLPGWLDQVRLLAHEHLPGVSFGDGVEQALGLDLPVAELDGLIDQVQQPVQSLPEKATADSVRLVARINGQPLAERASHVEQLDRLVLRVRREGSLISRRTMTMETLPTETNFDVQSPAAQPQPSSAIIPASFAEPPITTRLPPVSN